MPGAFPALALVDLDGTLLSVSSERLYLTQLLRSGVVRPPGILRMLLGYAVHPVLTVREGKGWNRRYLTGISAAKAACEAENLARDSLLSRLRPTVTDMLANLSAGGCRVVLVTASLSWLAKPVAEAVEADGLMASVPEETGGVLTGRLSGPRPWGRAKSTIALAICEREGVEPADCMALGDSWSDRHMMLACGRAVAVHPSRGLRKLATEKGWQVIEGRHARWA